MTLWRALARWWRNPPLDRPVFQIGYIATIGAGVATLLVPPSTIANELGPVMSVAWAVMFIMGGTIGALTIYTDHWQLERLGIKTAGLGLLVYAAVIIALHVSEPGSRLTQLGMIIGTGGLYLARLRQITGWDYKPPIEE